jgi:hypothetical protein
VRAGDVIISREGSGVGHGTGATLGEAHESALKEAETDAMKRALTTFGNLFGLALYDKDQRGVRGAVIRKIDAVNPALAWTVLSADGHAIASCSDPKAYCTRLRQVLGASSEVAFLRALWNQNAAVVQSLHAHRPDLITRKGVHFAKVLEQVFEAQLNKLTAQEGSAAVAPAVDKTMLTIAVPKRVRDDLHRQFVATLPCLVCGRTPTHAHHLRFTQPRALGRKVSDEWVVPLCNLHHRSLHDGGNEEAWWGQHRIDPVSEAGRLWRTHHPTEPAAAPARAETSQPEPEAIERPPSEAPLSAAVE